jgi:hypothetical protein
MGGTAIGKRLDQDDRGRFDGLSGKRPWPARRYQAAGNEKALDAS